MSIVALALRLSAVMALQGAATVAAGRVFDSAVLPLDQLASKDPKPFVSISTEDETARPSGRDLNNGDRTIDLVIEIAIGQTVPLPAEGGEAFAVLDTDANLELSLAVISRQVHACLFGAGGGAWGDVFRSFCKAIEEYAGRRGIPNKEGQRFAARQMAYRIKAPAEPAFDQAVLSGTPFAKFLAAADAQPGFEQIASIIRHAIEGKPIGWPELYTKSSVDGGLTEEEGQKIGIAPLGGNPSAPISQMTIDPSGFVADEAAIDAALPPEEP